jgi:16S rRNA (guanine966-N2)-methyltransferase
MADAGRVIAGTARGVRLAAPGPGTRPLTDRVKQTLFGILDPVLEGAVVLDLFAGSGAAAIEALSRGAASAVLVEKDAGAARVIVENLRRARVAAAATVVRRDAVAWLAEAARTDEPARADEPAPADERGHVRFDVVIVDPPYADTESLVRVLAAVGPLVADGGVVVAKHFWRDAPPARVGLLASDRVRRFGETALTFYRRAGMREEADQG